MAGTKVIDYGMYTTAGNRAVGQIVKIARAIGSPWERVQKYLEELAEDHPEFGEATDTQVREAVYEALERDTASR